MTIKFQINYFAHYGQRLAVVGNAPELGGGNPLQGLSLEYRSDGNWQVAAVLADPPTQLNYYYVLLDDQGRLIDAEWGEGRRLTLVPERGTLLLDDHWIAKKEPENTFHSSAFRNVIFRQQQTFASPPLEPATGKKIVRFQMLAPRVPKGARLALLGNLPELGNWNYGEAVLLDNQDFPLWTTEIALAGDQKVEYKYGYCDVHTGRVTLLEAGPNRTLDLPAAFEFDSLVRSDVHFAHPAGPWKGAGVAIPVFSIRTEKGLGIGEFLDLKLLADWAAKTGLQMVQILPVNDTIANFDFLDSYPYSAISVFALNPIYLNIDALGFVEETIGRDNLEADRQRLNALEVVDVEEVVRLKLRCAHQIFDFVKRDFLKSTEFQQYFSENKQWLRPYAVFCYLRDEFGTADFSQWGEKAECTAELLDEHTSPGFSDYDDVGFYYFLQFHLDRQLREATAYARSKGIVLKGDLPIGIYRHSVDAWYQPRLYHMDGQAGAPPDPFSEDGQNWGFPTYNWAEMAKDDYQWWKDRMVQLARYFDAYRIDHILGFFRIWEIPIEQVNGMLGFFNPALPITPEELKAKGIPFDRKRFCEPYLPHHLLEATFGEDTAYIKQHFLDEYAYHQYRFKPQLDTQRKIDDFLDDPQRADRKHLREKLFELVANVLFIEVPGSGGTEFHPRIAMENTASFRELDPETRHKLKALYIDFFFHRQEAFWRDRAMEKLPTLKAATDMLVCGEDLGMVPDCVPGVMQELEILSLEIQRMSKNPATEFLQTEDIPYLSVVSPSTHDMATIRGWWEEEKWDVIQRFYENELGMDGEHPFYCEPYVAQAIINQHLHWPAMWAVFPIQDILAMDGRIRREDPRAERINIPSRPNHYWQYRMHLTMEQLLEENALNGMLASLLQSAKRRP